MPNGSDGTLERELVIQEHQQHPMVQAAERALEAEIPTKERYQHAGRYTAKRQEFHKAIIEGFRHPGPGRENGKPPIFRLVIGHPGSGRTTLIRQMPDQDQFAIVSLERVMRCFPEFTRETALTTYMEARDLLHAIVLDLVERREPFILESLGYEAENLKRICEALKGRGFRIELIFVDLPFLKAAQRAHASFLRGHGPYIPTYVILDGSLDEHLGELADQLTEHR